MTLLSATDNDDGAVAESARLLERHPRATWPSVSSPSVAFWLDVHERLRRDAAGLTAALDEYSRGRSSPAQLAVVAAPRLRGLIASMQGHHQIEDFRYFPAFRHAEPKLAACFDRLEAAHRTLGLSVDLALAALGELRGAAEQAARAAATPRLAAERYVAAAATLCRELERHLCDEENLVVPLLIERGPLVTDE
jgi:hypothetical protein